MLRSLRFAFILCLALVRRPVALVRILGHDVLKVAPKRLNGRKLGANLRDFLERAVQLVDVLQDQLKALGRH
jgi:hypothetical protein